MKKLGRKNDPHYRIVAAQSETKRDGKSLEVIGHYTPGNDKTKLVIDNELFDKWVKRGAQITDSVKNLMRTESKNAK